MNTARTYDRAVRGLLDLDTLATLPAVIVGVGSGGARLAIELNKLLIPLWLVDLPGETLQEHNLIRHPLGRRSVGMNKVDAVKAALDADGSGARVGARELDCRDRSPFEDLLAEANPAHVFIAVDGEEATRAAAYSCTRLSCSFSTAGLYEDGSAGEIFVRPQPGRLVPPPACYGCLSARLAIRTNDATRKPNYGDDPEQPTVIAATGFDIGRVALVQCKLGIDCMRGMPPPFNFVQIALGVKPLTGTTGPMAVTTVLIDPLPDCLVCDEAQSR